MRRYPWLVVSLLALAGVLLLVAFPTRAYLDQVHQRQELTARVKTLSGENTALAEQAGRLQSDETIERLARERYQLVRPGEEAYAILPDGATPPAPAAERAPPTSPSQSWWERAWARVTSIL
ncbi:MAG: septum formation initiator family protein [Acidimicrobiales bacterium]